MREGNQVPQQRGANVNDFERIEVQLQLQLFGGLQRRGGHRHKGGHVETGLWREERKEKGNI
jgi:hypothetical protein